MTYNKEYQRAYLQKNRERIVAQQRAWRQRNPDKVKAMKSRFRANNKPRLLIEEKAYRDANRERLRARWREQASRKKEVHRWYKVKQKHGITKAQYFAQFVKQEGCCAICRRLPHKNQPWLDIDHCHKTGQIRGLLCHNCNVGLGNFQDASYLLQSAIGYLTFWFEK